MEFGRWQEDSRLYEFAEYMKACGYILVCVTGNFIFVHSDFGIKQNEDIYTLLSKSGSYDYMLIKEGISADEYHNMIERARVEWDFFTKTSKPQIIEI
jgi:hypothetical protein